MILPLLKAEEALERGDYEQCIKLLEKISSEYSLSEDDKSEVKVLLVTAYLGKGENEKAIIMCKDLTKCSDKNFREKAKQLLPILKAPSLIRPTNWSVRIPSIDQKQSNSLKLVNSIKRKKSGDKSRSYYPPTGETKDLDLGFSILVLIVISILFTVLT